MAVRVRLRRRITPTALRRRQSVRTGISGTRNRGERRRDRRPAAMGSVRSRRHRTVRPVRVRQAAVVTGTAQRRPCRAAAVILTASDAGSRERARSSTCISPSCAARRMADRGQVSEARRVPATVVDRTPYPVITRRVVAGTPQAEAAATPVVEADILAADIASHIKLL